ncbi:uncharacterized protein LOC108705458 [Xenopus laevis]|uniref:Uncharacterized protein LOC108705458 n=1 Tax=Xenopus laevis TaxID=8355 RepID=A0A8J1LVF4_XENLA|nr:uncharacterized protein LOC108705458 [Xenopus laevis]
MDHNQLRDDIQNFRLDNCPLGNQGYNRVLLQLFGYVGQGRSALINSLKYVLSKGKYIMHAESGCAITLERKAYELTPTITVVDNRGLAHMNNFEMRTVYAQLGNFMPLNEKVEWRYGYEDFVYKLEDADLDPNYTDFIVPVFVHTVQCVLIENEKGKTRDIFRNCRNLTGVFPIVVLTSKTHGNYFEVEKKFRCLGAERIVAVENYFEDDQLQTLGRNTDFLMLLKSALDDVTFRMEYPRNPREERIERKKFLLKYAHDTDVAKREEKLKEKEQQTAKNNICNIQ